VARSVVVAEIAILGRYFGTTSMAIVGVRLWFQFLLSLGRQWARCQLPPCFPGTGTRIKPLTMQAVLAASRYFNLSAIGVDQGCFGDLGGGENG
jgi:hypothetical protein